MKLGKVLWWDRRDQEGIIVDGQDRQFYFNHSVLDQRTLKKIDDGKLIEFEPVELSNSRLCAKNIMVITTRSQKKAEQRFLQDRQLDLEFAG